MRSGPQPDFRPPAVAAARRWSVLLCLQFAMGLAVCAAPAQEPAETGPEDVPADNRFDPGRMHSSLVVPHTALTRFRYPVIDAHSHDSYAQTPEQVSAWVQLQEKLNVAQCFIFTGKSGAEFQAAAARYAGAYPKRFVMFAGISAAGIGTPAYADLLRERLRADVQAGARGLGELTDKGMGLVRVEDKAWLDQLAEARANKPEEKADVVSGAG